MVPHGQFSICFLKVGSGIGKMEKGGENKIMQGKRKVRKPGL